ncbi:MAG: RsmD family RNA methyltransferase [Bacteriovoracales bacterium]|nr:RsmD family RNA methyltransferase [Bacteriovoracales bacterium]
MGIKILGGEAKGLGLKAPRDAGIRPMSQGLKRRPFDAAGPLGGVHFVDLCAGTGAVGLEAYSRGASSVLFYEKNPRHYRLLLENLARFKENYFHEDRPLRAVCADCFHWPGWGGECADHLLFFAPPYPKHELYRRLFKTLARSPFCGKLWVESDRQKGLSQADLEEYATAQKVYRQGTGFVCVFDFGDRL